MIRLIHTWVTGVLILALPTIVNAETVGVFFDPEVAQIKFAAGDVKSALEQNQFTVEMLPVAALNATYAHKKVVIALASDATANNVLTTQGGGKVAGLGEQAYGLRTTEAPQKSYWALGGDTNGAMYGGLQIAENIRFHQLTGTYNSEESPAILKRGIKLNLPWDKVSGTYGRYDLGTYDGTSAQLAIDDVWDLAFWTTWFDEMARNRYNTVSLWSCNPFSSLVSVPGYEDCSIQDVTEYSGKVTRMTIEQKIEFWQKVMAYAKDRGFEFLLFNWNVFTYGATGKHGITDAGHGATNSATIDYMYKAMIALLETYPDLDGFGLSIGENRGTEEFAWQAYGRAMHDYAVANPKRKVKFIHRLHYGKFDDMLKLFEPLRKLENVSFDISIKHSQAHMYSTATPNWWPNEYRKVRENGLKTWLTVRNDSFYYLTWGDPDYARTYIKGMLGLGSIFKGFYMGSDGFNPTRTFFHKDNALNGRLEILRQQYQMMLWGRLSYNPKTPDTIFVEYMHHKYPSINEGDLFAAWSKSSRGIQRANEMINKDFEMDYKWWPEGCQRDTRMGNNPKSSLYKKPAFVTVADFGEADVAPGSSVANIANSAAGRLSDKKSSYVVADEIESDALKALSLVSSINSGEQVELGAALQNIRALSYLSLYYAHKIRGATHLKADQKDKARDALGRAYCWWMKYSKLMDSLYTGMKMQRSVDLPHWHVHDESVLKEYTDLGGTGIPSYDEETSP